ncbi:MAG: MmgE/PrpD family, partial [Candidatus Eremiobacteraeota bacterium]|nr:MmgE/PrpD family [Candidatus Eremiobacteraeota bacterium]
MSSAAPATGASEALARLIAGTHTGAAFESALQAARARLVTAQTAPCTPNDISDLASRALTSYGTAFRHAFVTATNLAATPGAAIIAAAIVSAELAERGETDVVEGIAIGREVAARLERALTLDGPWDAVAVVAGIAAAAAAARAAALDAEAARNAIGLAATQAAGLGVTDGTPA